MTRKRRRLMVLLLCGLGLGSATALTLSALSQNLTYFVSPADLLKSTYVGRHVRLGGLVQQGSITRSHGSGAEVAFRVTDSTASVPIVYKGILPDLLREGQGVVVLGASDSDGLFHATEVLAKHDENYMPPEVVEALKKSGKWNPSTGAPPPGAAWGQALTNKAPAG